MRANLYSIDSADILDFDTYCPEDDGCFSFPIEMEIGYEGFEGGDLFQMTVCTPAWISSGHRDQIAVLDPTFLIVFRYDWHAIHTAIGNIINGYTATTGRRFRKN